MKFSYKPLESKFLEYDFDSNFLTIFYNNKIIKLIFYETFCPIENNIPTNLMT